MKEVHAFACTPTTLYRCTCIFDAKPQVNRSETSEEMQLHFKERSVRRTRIGLVGKVLFKLFYTVIVVFPLNLRTITPKISFWRLKTYFIYVHPWKVRGGGCLFYAPPFQKEEWNGVAYRVVKRWGNSCIEDAKKWSCICDAHDEKWNGVE